MKPHSCTTPLAGFNVRGVPVRCTNHAPGVNVPATKVFGYRRYCPSCAESFAAYSRDKFGGDSVQGDKVSLQREGDEACLGWQP